MIYFRKRPYVWFIAPGLLIYTLFVIYPMLSTFLNSLTSWNGISTKHFVGLDNYSFLFNDLLYAPQLKRALYNGVYIVIVCYLIQIPLALYFAYVLDKKIAFHQFFQAVVFLPQILSMVAISFLVLLFLDPNFGVISEFLRMIGLDSWVISWFAGGDKMKWLVAMVNSWKGLGFLVVVILANMQSIPESYTEAARLDGASEARIFLRITLPLLAPSVGISCMAIFIGGIATFEVPFLIGGLGGGPGGAVDTIGTFFYRTTFGDPQLTNNIGLGTAIAVLQFAIIFIVIAIQMMLFRRREIQYD